MARSTNLPRARRTIRYSHRMFIRFLPMITGLLPIIGANIAYAIGVIFETVPVCFPYTEGCVSISAAGRPPPGSFLFRAVHLPYATVLAATWYFAWAWLEAAAPGRHRQRGLAMLGCGLIASLALILYVTFLGTREPIYEFMRRGGVYFYFAGATFAQILFTTMLLSQTRDSGDQILRRCALFMLGLCVLPFVLGLANLGQKAVLAKAVADPIENSIEWIAAFFMQAWYVVLYVVWRRTGFDLAATVCLRRGRETLPH